MDCLDATFKKLWECDPCDIPSISRYERAHYIIDVNERWDNLMATEYVRTMMGKVVDGDEIRPENVLHHIREFLSDLHMTNVKLIMGNTRRSIISFFNGIFHSGINLLPFKWWYEMSIRMEKLLTVSFALERINWESISTSEPTALCIPQSLVAICFYLDRLKESSTVKAYEKLHSDIVKNAIPSWANIYLDNNTKDLHME